MVKLKHGQLEAIEKLRNGSILFGTVGSGKSLTSLVYYVRQCGGLEFKLTPFKTPLDLYIITPAIKRDRYEWDKEMLWLLIGMQENVKVVVDSWNNIGKYTKVQDAFFIFDEQRLIGSGTWVRSFLKIAKKNKFILLTATPGDKWMDYIPIFIANKFYDDRYSFILEHVVYHPYLKFPKIIKYNNEEKLRYYRDQLLVTIPQDEEKKKERVYETVSFQFNVNQYRVQILGKRWNPWTDEPIRTTASMWYLLRKACNIGNGQLGKLIELTLKHKRVILFYNYNYELDDIKTALGYELPYISKEHGIPIPTVAEHNSHKHEPVPETDYWIYLVQYNSGSEGWNCIKTDAMVFWSLNSSYRTMIQAMGRIDRMDSPYNTLYYYSFITNSHIDYAIGLSLTAKKEFNLRRYREPGYDTPDQVTMHVETPEERESYKRYVDATRSKKNY